jgi:hypothetical protein
MPLAAVGLFIMVLGVLATLNLGQAVHQKIKLQNTADAAAYTLASMEARTFNYIAFLNRAQIAHYNTAMVVQSYMSWVGFQIALFGAASDLMITAKNAVIVGTRFPYPLKIPYNAARGFYEMMAQLAERFRKLAVQFYEMQMVGDELGHNIVEAMALFNRDAIWQTQLARAGILNVHILTGMQNYIEKHDPDISFTQGKSMLLNLLVNGALNSIEYYQTFENASGMNPSLFGIVRDYKRVFPAWKGDYHSKNDAGRKEAYRIMSELCHASRSPQFVSNRSDNTAHAIAIMATVFGQKQGQTKFTTENTMQGAEVPTIGSDGNYVDPLNLSSSDYLESGTGFSAAAIGFVQYTADNKVGDAISAYQDKIKHYRYTGPDSTSENKISPSGGTKVIAVPFPTGNATSAKNKPHDQTWPGFAPYFLFKAKGDRTADFNQPSTWIFLNKHHKDFQTDSGSHSDGRAPWYSKFTWQNGPQVAALDTTVGGSRNSYLFEGLNVLSRGMAYYHRPGNWREHPNFFNPFWRARLAPVGQKLQAFWDRWVTQNISTSSESAVVQTAVTVLKNAQMDLFTAAITSLVTH